MSGLQFNWIARMMRDMAEGREEQKLSRSMFVLDSRTSAFENFGRNVDE